MGRASVAFSTCFDVVPDETRPWKPEMAPQAMVMNRKGIIGGAPSGDLYVDVELEAHERFEREGFDLIYRSKVSFLEAALGTKTEITLPNDQTEKIKISAGTQPGTVISLEGRGIPRLDRRSRGALHIVVDVHVPTQLSRKARKALAGLEDELAVPGRD